MAMVAKMSPEEREALRRLKIVEKGMSEIREASSSFTAHKRGLATNPRAHGDGIIRALEIYEQYLKNQQEDVRRAKAGIYAFQRAANEGSSTIPRRPYSRPYSRII